MTDRTGQQLGIYRLVSLIGTGGFAEVYVGQHVRLDLQAAIKVLHTNMRGVEAARFQREAQIIARLAHPSIVRVFDFDVQDEVAFLVMAYAPNGSLRVRHPKGNVVPYPLVVSYIRQVAGALQYAHEQRLIHRDVKPKIPVSAFPRCRALPWPWSRPGGERQPWPGRFPANLPPQMRPLHQSIAPSQWCLASSPHPARHRPRN